MTETLTHGIKIITKGTKTTYLDITNETYRQVGAIEANIINKKIKGRVEKIRKINRLSYGSTTSIEMAVTPKSSL
jgi:hypothetical protein